MNSAEVNNANVLDEKPTDSEEDDWFGQWSYV